MILPYKLIHPHAKPPAFAHTDDACFDVACVSRSDVIGNSRIYDTGIAFVPPSGYDIDFYIRSSLAFGSRDNDGDFILSNGVAIIDNPYRGSIKLKLTYIGNKIPDWPKVGDRIAQGRLVKKVKTTFEEVTELDETERGANGLGSTGR